MAAGKQVTTPPNGVATAKIEELAETPDYGLVAGIERWYSVAETARFFERSPQWLYDRLSRKKLVYPDGSPIEPHLVGDGPKPIRRFNLELISAIALCLYRVGTVKMPELKVVMRRIAEAEWGAFDPSAVYDDE